MEVPHVGGDGGLGRRVYGWERRERRERGCGPSNGVEVSGGGTHGWNDGVVDGVGVGGRGGAF